MNTVTFSLRSAKPTDADVLARLIRHAFEARPATDPPPSALRETADKVAAHLTAGGGEVAEIDGVIVGGVLWSQDADSLHVSRLAVDPELRRRGIGRALLLAVEAEARRRNLIRLKLSTRVSLADNRRLFAAVGYREVQLHSHEGFTKPTYLDLERVVS